MQSSDVHSAWQRAASERARAYGWISHHSIAVGEQIRGTEDTSLEDIEGLVVLLLLEQLIWFLTFSPILAELVGD